MFGGVNDAINPFGLKRWVKQRRLSDRRISQDLCYGENANCSLKYSLLTTSKTPSPSSENRENLAQDWTVRRLGQILQHRIVGEFESIRTNVVPCRRPEPPLIWHGADSRPANRYPLAAVSCTLVMEPPHHPGRTVTRCSKSKALIEEYGSGLRHSFQNNVLVRQTLNLGT